MLGGQLLPLCLCIKYILIIIQTPIHNTYYGNTFDPYLIIIKILNVHFDDFDLHQKINNSIITEKY